LNTIAAKGAADEGLTTTAATGATGAGDLAGDEGSERGVREIVFGPTTQPRIR